MTQAYVYKWTHIPTLKWYVGSRTKKGCHPDDGYICSSKLVKPLIECNTAEWKREIIDIGDPSEMRELEFEILNLFDAARDLRSFNKSNGRRQFVNLSDGPGPMTGKKHSLETRKRIGLSGKGRIKSKEECLKVSQALKGKSKTPEHIEKMRIANLGKRYSDEHKARLSIIHKEAARKLTPEERKLKFSTNAGKTLGPATEERKKNISIARLEGVRINRVSCIHCHKEMHAAHFYRHKHC
jgi:hypothetical protein